MAPAINENKKIRTYEISLWTLQDDFITVLKSATMENKGQIWEGKAHFGVDGLQELKFKIPMYIYENGERIENELYTSLCTHQHKQITPNLRKIKLIFNKAELDERTYEFLITKVTDEHDNDELYCNIECEGLAFNELGRIGYSISLNSEDFYEEYKQWALNSIGDEAAKASEPIANLQWWLGRFGNNLQPYPTDGSYINPGIWYYTIEMDWSSEMGGNQNLDSHIVYEAPYATSWNYTTDNIIPKKIQWVQEKARLVDLEQSNVYNLTQSLAEAFGIFCRYEYLHDANQHITGRKVIFYNNFFYEAAGNIDLNYPYGASYIAREVDSEHVVTKMFVKAVEDDSSYNNLISIMNTPANRSGEDYLLNFDYLHDIGTISEEQYARIAPYEKDMRFINDAMIPFESQLVEVESKLPEAEASLTIAENAIQLDNERLGAANDLLKKLTNDTGWIEVKESQPDTGILIKQKDDNSTDYGPYSVKLSKQGIDPGSIRVFRTYMIRINEEPETEEESEKDEETPTIQKNKYVGKLYDELFTGEIETDEFGDPIKINNLYTSSFNNSSTDTATLISSGSKLVYLTYRYDPKLYYDKVIATWQNRLAKDQSDKEKYGKEVEKLTILKEKLTEILDLLREEKKTRKERFERLMGPALREGSWEPEERNDCGEHHEDFFKIGYEDSVENLVSIENGTTGGFADEKDLFIWDTELFEGETSLTYELGVDQEVTSYKIIDISNAIAYWKDNFFDDLNDIFKSLCFRFQDISIEGLERSDILKYRNFSVGVSAELGFVKIEEEGKQVIKPVLILYETQDLKQEDLSNEAELGGITVSLATSKEKISIEVTDSTIDESGNIVKTPKTLTSYVQILKSEWTFPFNGITINENESNEKQYSGLNWLNAKYCKRVYPRIEIKSSTLKTSSDQLIVSYNQKELEAYIDYSILTRLPTGAQALDSQETRTPEKIVKDILDGESVNDSDKYSDPCYYITIKPEVLLQYGDLKILNILYNLSLTDLGIYLDAIQVLKENAYPKVSYSIKPNIVDERFIHKAYDMLAHIVNINDLDLHFKNVRGYISEVELDLDQPWNDDIVIKNYKNKFEDLFSTIIAETEEMKKAGNFFNLAGSAFTLNGSLEPYVLENSLRKVDLNYAFNHGKLIISEENGIWGLSEAGVVAFRGGGIFTSTRKDRAGNWIWNTGIVPQGINADLITTGQLDTNRVMVYAGDKLRFQLNGDGLFAYKSFFDDIGSIIEATSQNNSLEVGKVNTLIASQGDVDAAQFVRMYSEGLFLTVKEGALVLNRDKTNYLTIQNGNEYYIEREYKAMKRTNIEGKNDQNDESNITETETYHYKRDANSGEIIRDTSGNPIIVVKKFMNIPSEGLNRIEISWNGLIMRDWTNTPTFFADPDTGDLYLSGTIFAKDFYVIDDSYSSDYDPAKRIPFQNWADIKFEDHVQVSKNLKIVFDKAGEILNKAWWSLSDLANETLENASILSDFLDKAKDMPHNPIEFVTGNGNNTVSALRLHPTEGIWMGSTNEIVFYSGDYNTRKIIDNEQEISISDKIPSAEEDEATKGASVIINKDRIMLGVVSVNSNNTTINSGSAVDIKRDYIVLATGANVDILRGTQDSNSDPYNTLKTDSNIAGVVIEKNVIGLATQTENSRNLVLMDENGILIGNATRTITNEEASTTTTVTVTDPNITYNGSSSYNMKIIVEENEVSNTTIDFKEHSLDTEGSFISLQKDKLLIGSSGNFYLNATNILIDSAAIDGTGYKGTIMRLGPTTDPGLIFDGENLWIKGNIYAGGTYIYYLDDNNNWASSNFNDYIFGQTNQRINEAFSIAGEILADINNSFDYLNELDNFNKEIFENFSKSIKTRLTSVEAYGPYHHWNFKPGDIWVKTETIGIVSNLNNKYENIASNSNPYKTNNAKIIKKYIAMAYWSEVYTSADQAKNDNSVSSTAGWEEVDSTATSGAKMYIDPNTGIISMWASEGIHLFSDGRIAANGQERTDLGESVVDITTAGIILASSEKIELGVSGDINNNIASGDFSGIKMDNTGIWMGTSSGIRLYSSTTAAATNEEPATPITNSRANVEIDSSHIILGMIGVAGSTVFEMKNDRIIMGAQENRNNLLADTFNPNVAGVRIKQDQIGLVTKDSGNTNIILMDEDGIVIGSKASNDSNNLNSYKQSGIVINSNSITALSASINLGTFSGNNQSYVKIAPNNIQLKSEEYYTSGTIEYAVNGIDLSSNYLKIGTTSFLTGNRTMFNGLEINKNLLSLVGVSGYIQFKDAAEDNPKFRVDEEGNIYCNSITCRQGAPATETVVIPTQTTETPSAINETILNPFGEQFNYDDIPRTKVCSQNINITQAGTYDIILTLYKNANQTSGIVQSGYFDFIQLEVTWIDPDTEEVKKEKRTGALAWNSNEGEITQQDSSDYREKAVQFSNWELHQGRNTLKITFRIGNDLHYYLRVDSMVVGVYGRNFKHGSTSSTVTAGWTGNTYTVTPNSGGTAIASTTISLSRDSIVTTAPNSNLILGDGITASSDEVQYLPIKVKSGNNDELISKYIQINKAASSTPNVSDVKVNNPSGTWTLYPGNTFDSSGNLAPLQITINDNPKTLKLLSGNKIEVKYPTLSMSATKNTTYTGNTFLNTITPSNSDQIFFVKTYEADDVGKEAKSSGYIKVKGITSIIPSSSLNQWNISKDDNFNTKTITTGYKINDEATVTVTNKVLDYIVKTLMPLRENNSNFSPEYLTWKSGDGVVQITLYITDNHYITLIYDKENAESFQKDFSFS